MSVYPKQKTGEALGILYLAASVLLLLSLLSYHPLDPSWNVSSPATGYANQIGKFGAWLADLLFQAAGLPAFLLPLALLRLGYRKVRGRRTEYPALQLLGQTGLLLSLCAGLALAEPFLPLRLDFAAGGLAGALIARLLLSAFNLAGSAVVAATVFLLALVLTTRFSLLALLDWLGGLGWPRAADLRARWVRWRKSRRDRRQLKAKKEAEVMAQQPPPRAAALEPVAAPSAPAAEAVSPPTLNWEPLVRSQEDRAALSRQSSRRPAEEAAQRPYQPPPLEYLTPPEGDLLVDESELLERAERLTAKYAEFGVLGRVLQIHPGPVVTTFEFRPDAGVKYSRMTALVDDLCLAMKAESIRIDRIPGKNTVGIEVPNSSRQVILLREILGSAAFQQSESLLSLGLGKLINGNTYVSDLARMPHLLIAGATGAGKSVAVNCIICSIVYKASPRDVRFIMIDPKRLELGLYADIPHLLTPIVTDPKEAANALGWAVREMELRYRTLARFGVRNLAQYNRLAAERKDLGGDAEPEPLEPLPIIVVIVDELADLMMTAGKEVEASLTRLAQMARAIGIHLILATQRPSVDVITGLIKANFPSRVSFRVSSKVDSRTVLDSNGAEQLLGQGDMLFLSPRTSRPIRIHGGFVTEKEIRRIVEHLQLQGQPLYREDVLQAEEEKESALADVEDLEDSLYDEAARFVVETGKASTSLLQRRLRIGYGRAARLLDMMEHEGIIGPPDGSRAREVLVPVNYFDEVDAP